MMKIFRMHGRSIRDALKSVFRNYSLSLASVSCITITLVIVAVSIIASFNVENFAKEIESVCKNRCRRKRYRKWNDRNKKYGEC